MAVTGGGRRSSRKTREVGAYGNKRGKEAQARRRAIRLATPRVANALAEARAERERIAALVERSADVSLDATVGVPIRKWVRSIGALVDVEVERPVPLVDLSNRTEGDRGWSLGQARSLYLDGYPLPWVVARTGFGGFWFVDLMDRDGYARDLSVERRPEW